MSDEFERLLKHVPEAVPPPDPVLTSRIREALLEAFRPRRRESLRRKLLIATAALLVGGTGFGAGRWTSPVQRGERTLHRRSPGRRRRIR